MPYLTPAGQSMAIPRHTKPKAPPSSRDPSHTTRPRRATTSSISSSGAGSSTLSPLPHSPIPPRAHTRRASPPSTAAQRAERHSQLYIIEDQSTPRASDMSESPLRASSSLDNLDALSSTLDQTHLAPEEEVPESDLRRSSTPSLCDAASASSASVASLNNQDDLEEVESASASGQDTPATSVTSTRNGGVERDDAVGRYREAMRVYTRNLYLEAKLQSTHEENKRNKEYNQFGVKMSGMEKLAAKKALARQLMAGASHCD